MSLPALLNQPLTILHRGTTSTDDYGKDVPGTVSTTDTEGYVEQTDRTEITVDQETYVTDWLVVLPADVEVDASDRIVYGSATFEIIGQPHRVWNPRTRSVHHAECRCRQVTG